MLGEHQISAHNLFGLTPGFLFVQEQAHLTDILQMIKQTLHHLTVPYDMSCTAQLQLS